MPKHILIIEDDADTLEMMNFILADEGYLVTAWQDCKTIEAIKDLKPDLILMDNRLSDVFGKEICKKLKEDVESDDIPVILLSASPKLEQIAIESLANGFLNKPFDITELIEIARSWTSRI
jgi:two-component system phosphate regulon response regulator PhoB